MQMHLFTFLKVYFHCVHIENCTLQALLLNLKSNVVEAKEATVAYVEDCPTPNHDSFCVYVV